MPLRNHDRDMFENLRQFLIVWFIKAVQKYGPRRVRVLGRSFEISEEVFNPAFYFTSMFMAKNIRVTRDDTVLDMGTGSGIQAIIAGQTASRVIAVDINPQAVRYARRNVCANGLDGTVSVVEGDLFSSLDRRCKFDVIIFTPPYLKGRPGNDFERALFDFNKNLLRRFFRDAREYIAAGGYVQMLYSSIAAPAQALKIAEEFGWRHEVTVRERTLAEEFLIYRFSLN